MPDPEPPPAPAGPFLVVLGIGQDGGSPQVGDGDLERWDLVGGERLLPTALGLVDPRTERRWLFEATPDLREQLIALDRLQLRQDRPGIDGVFLTHAHVGHYVGLLQFGFEVMGADRVPVWAMPEMADFLRSNGPWSQLVEYENIELRPLADRETVHLGVGPRDQLRVTPLEVPHRREYSETVGYRIEGPNRSVLFIPDINSWEEWDELGVRIEDEIAAVDIAYLDGCFWNHGEIPGRDMSGFPHPLIKESLDRLAALADSERAKVRWIHLNHTNPAAVPGSAERAEVEAAGMRIAEQGERVDL